MGKEIVAKEVDPNSESWDELIVKHEEALFGADDGAGSSDKSVIERLDDLEAADVAAMHYKGQVASKDELPSDAAVGDLYNVADTGANYAFNGSSWDDISLMNLATTTSAGLVKLGTSITDLKGYVGLNTSGQMQVKQATDDDYGVVKHKEVVKASKWQGPDGKYYVGLNEGNRILNMQNKPILGVSNLTWDDGTSITFPSTSGEVALAADVEAAKTAATTAVEAEATRAKAAEATNATAISTEATRAKAAEATLTTATETNATNIATNATAISTETARAKAAEETNATAISAEATRAKNAEALLAPIASPTFTGTATAATLKTTKNVTFGGTGSVSFLKSDGTSETLANLEARVAALEAAANSEADTTSDDAATIV